MRKQIYDLIYSNESEPIKKLNEPFCFMRAEVALKKKNFSIWKLNYKQQNIHAHDYYQIWYIFRGSCRHRIDNKEFILNSSDIIFIPPFSYHSMSDGSDDLIVIGVDFSEQFFSTTEVDKDLMLYCVKPLYLNQGNKHSVFWADNDIENLILEMFNEFALKHDFYNIIIKINLTKLIIMAERMNNQNDITHSKTEHAISETLKYIHTNFNEKISIQNLCKIANMSETLLSTCFKNITGKTIIEYINTLKINKAKQLLAETDMRITDISYELGFNDGAYFNRVFKKIANLTPNAYRKQKRK